MQACLRQPGSQAAYRQVSFLVIILLIIAIITITITIIQEYRLRWSFSSPFEPRKKVIHGDISPTLVL
jgi:hypothetical protein